MSYVLFNIYMHYLIRKVLKRNSLYQKNICLFKKRNHIEKTPIQDELGGKEGPLPVFPLVTSTNMVNSPYNFLTFIFNPYAILV